MVRISRSILVVICALAIAASAVPAFAAEAPVRWKMVDVTVQSSDPETLLLVAGELPEGTKLPVEAELAVPKGLKMQWIGEVLGGDPSKDPALKYKKSTVDGMDIYRFTMTKAKVAQIEGNVPGVTSFDGSAYATALKWKVVGATDQVRVNQRLPLNTKIVEGVDGAELLPGEGARYYSKTFDKPKDGSVLDMAFTYNVVAGAAGSSGASAPAKDSPAPIIITILAVLGFGALFYNVNNKMKAKAAEEEAAAAKAKPAKNTAAAKATAKADEAFGEDDDVEVAGGAKKRNPLLIPMVVVIGVLVAGFAFASTKGTTAQVYGGEVSRSFGSSDACQASSYPITPAQGVNLAEKADELLAAFEGKDGIGNVTLSIDESRLDVEWCESSQTEETIRQTITATGLVALGEVTPIAPSGGQEAAPAN